MSDHQHPHDHHHPHDGAFDRRGMLRVGGLGLGAILLAACKSSNSASTSTAASNSTAATSSAAASTSTLAVLTSLPGFAQFAATVNTFAEGDYWLVESTGMPTHNVMVGITSWQQQVPLPQPYTGANAWRFPTTPVMAETPVSARTGLFRGAIAIAVNGVPIFNALNNRGDDAFLAGELDDWGGHAGRADDYHYHVAPLHLQEAVGATNPIAYALDGYAIYGAVEPDGSAMTELDDFNGHVGADGVYHYHGTTTYPYINGGLRGVVSVSDQVDPQPVTHSPRPAGEPLPGAVITNFETVSAGSYRLEYMLDGLLGSVEYAVSEAAIIFTFTDTTGAVHQETYAQ